VGCSHTTCAQDLRRSAKAAAADLHQAVLRSAAEAAEAAKEAIAAAARAECAADRVEAVGSHTCESDVDDGLEAMAESATAAKAAVAAADRAAKAAGAARAARAAAAAAGCTSAASKRVARLKGAAAPGGKRDVDTDELVVLRPFVITSQVTSSSAVPRSDRHYLHIWE
jgi:hypothetical protein